MASIRFSLPKGLEPIRVAQTFNAYLLGSLVFTNVKISDGTYPFGPYPKVHGENSWQLDTTNDYWLEIVGNECHLYDRYNNQVLLDALVQLFRLRYERPVSS